MARCLVWAQSCPSFFPPLMAMLFICVLSRVQHSFLPKEQRVGIFARQLPGNLGNEAFTSIQPERRSDGKGKGVGFSSRKLLGNLDHDKERLAAVKREWRSNGCDLTHLLEKFDPDDLPITCSNFHEIQMNTSMLGKGYWKRTVLGTWKGVDVAVKSCREDRHRCNDIMDARVEAAIHQHFNDAGSMLPILGLCGSTLVYPRMEPLHQGMFPLPRGTALRYARDTALALMHLHESPLGPLSHNDLWVSHLLLDAKGRVRLYDFNQVKYNGVPHGAGASGSRRCGHDHSFHADLLSPEEIAGLSPKQIPDSNRSLKELVRLKWRGAIQKRSQFLHEDVDIFWLGHLLWELFSGLVSAKNTGQPLPAYSGLSQYEVFEGFSTGTLRPPIVAIQDYPQDVQAVVEACWHTDPAKRPRAREVWRRLQVALDAFDAHQGARGSGQGSSMTNTTSSLSPATSLAVGPQAGAASVGFPERLKSLLHEECRLSAGESSWTDLHARMKYQKNDQTSRRFEKIRGSIATDFSSSGVRATPEVLVEIGSRFGCFGLDLASDAAFGYRLKVVSVEGSRCSPRAAPAQTEVSSRSDLKERVVFCNQISRAHMQALSSYGVKHGKFKVRYQLVLSILHHILLDHKTQAEFDMSLCKILWIAKTTFLELPSRKGSSRNIGGDFLPVWYGSARTAAEVVRRVLGGEGTVTTLLSTDQFGVVLRVDLPGSVKALFPETVLPDVLPTQK